MDGGGGSVFNEAVLEQGDGRPLRGGRDEHGYERGRARGYALVDGRARAADEIDEARAVRPRDGEGDTEISVRVHLPSPAERATHCFTGGCREDADTLPVLDFVLLLLRTSLEQLLFEGCQIEVRGTRVRSEGPHRAIYEHVCALACPRQGRQRAADLEPRPTGGDCVDDGIRRAVACRNRAPCLRPS